MRTIIALKPCPQGQQPGDEFTVPAAHAAALVLVGAARYVDSDSDASEGESLTSRARRRYARRDLTADA